MKDWKLYILNVILLIIVGYNILPNLSLNKSDFNTVSGLISSVQIEAEDFNRPKEMMFNNIGRERLIIIIADSHYHEYYVSDIYKEHWDELLSYHKSELPIVLYLGVDKGKEDPFRIEINGDVIYNTNVRFYRNILIILFTLALTIRNLFFYFKAEKDVVFDTQVQTADNSFVGFIKRKAIGFRDYFLD